MFSDNSFCICIKTSTNAGNLEEVPGSLVTFRDGAGSVWPEPTTVNYTKVYFSVSTNPDKSEDKVVKRETL